MSTEINTEVLESIDDFIPMPGAESVATADEKPNVLTAEKEADFGFLDEEENVETEETFDDIIKTDDIEDDDDIVVETKGRKKIDKGGTVEVFKKLIEDKIIVPFDDGKSIEEYTVNDYKELIALNIKDQVEKVREQTPIEFFEALPEKMQYAAKYIADGGTDLTGLFKALADMQEVEELDPQNENHAKRIVHQYLMATNFGNGDKELIEDQLTEWEETGLLSKKANQFKPKLNELEQEVINSKLKEQEDFKKLQMQRQEHYINNIYNVLKPNEINGVKLDAKRQKVLWDGLTKVEKGISGRPTNKLGRLLEEYQWGKEPRYDLIVEALWLLDDPEDYKAQIRKVVKAEVVADTVRKLKTEQDNKTTISRQQDDSEAKRTIKKPVNIFKR